MAVTKQKRSYINQPIGVTRFETGETQMWEAVANTAGRLNEIALKEGAKQAEQSGLDAAMAVEQSEIIAFDAETGKPRALDPKMFSGGIIARDAYKRVVEKRFGASIENELKIKAQELQLKYKFEPELFREEMSRYVADMHANAQGKWKETVKVGGVAITRATELNIQANAIEKNNQELALNIENKVDTFLNEEFYNNFVNFNKDLALNLVGTQADELIVEIEDAEAANILPVGSAEKFEDKFLATLGLYQAQEMLRDNTIIPLVGGDDQRNALSVALTTGDYNALNDDKYQDARKILTQLIATTSGDRAILSNIGNDIGKNIQILNAESQAKQKTQMILNVYEFGSQQIAKENEIEQSFFNGTADLTKNGKIETELEELDKEAKTLIQANMANDDPNIIKEIGLIQEQKETIKNTVLKQAIFDLAITEDISINEIKLALKGEPRFIAKLSSKGKVTVDFINRNKIKTVGFDGLFSDLARQYATENIQKIKNHTQAALTQENELRETLSLNSYEENERLYNSLINELNNPDGMYSKMDFERANALIRRLTLTISKEALGQIGFKNTNETRAALSYLDNTNPNALNSMPRIKEIIEDVEKNGITKSELLPTIVGINSRLNQIEVAQSSAQTAINNRNILYEGGSTNNEIMKATAQVNLIDPHILSESTEPFAIDIQDTTTKLTLEENLYDPNLMQNNPRLFAGLISSMELNTIPKKVEIIFNKAARGAVRKEQASAIVALAGTLMERLHPETNQPHNLLDKILNKETYSALKTAFLITREEGSENALEFLINASEIHTKDFNSRFDIFMDAYGHETLRDFFGSINDDLAKDGQAIEDFSPYVKHLYLSGMPMSEIKDKIEERYKESYGDTEGLVLDPGNQNVNRSRSSFASTYGKVQGLEPLVMDHLNTQLAAINPHYIFEKDQGVVGKVANFLEPFAAFMVGVTSQAILLDYNKEIDEASKKGIDPKNIAIKFFNDKVSEYNAKAIRVVAVPIPSSDQLVIHALYETTEEGKLSKPVRMPNGDHLAISNRDDYIIKFLNNKANTESGYTLKKLEDSIMYRKNLAERAKNSSNLSMHTAPWASPVPFEN
jgi:hypothetical protein